MNILEMQNEIDNVIAKLVSNYSVSGRRQQVVNKLIDVQRDLVGLAKDEGEEA